MATDEDTELRDLVAQALESNGALGKIRAQLRASVFLALEEQESVQNQTPLLNKELRQFVAEKDGLLVGALVREFLRHFNLDYTLCVFDPEAEWHGNVKAQFDSRDDLAAQLNIKETNETRSRPLLAEVLKRCLVPDSAVSRQAALTEVQTGVIEKNIINKQAPNTVQASNQKSELSSLADLPALDLNKPRPGDKLKYYEDLEYEEDFEADGNDFERSNVSPGPTETPRSIKAGDKRSNDDEDEEVEEDISEALTSDHSVSGSESHVHGDYSEDVHPIPTPASR